MTATDETKIAILKASLLNIGRLLPAGMEVFFYREGDDPRVRMQQVMPDGSTTEYAFGGHGPIYEVPTAGGFDLVAHLHRQREFSERTFGPGQRVQGVTDHIAKELIEVRDSGGDLKEWVDVVILGFDGAWRSGATPEQIIEAIVAKQTKNEGRTWPDWRAAEPGKAIEHVREQSGGD